MKKLDGNNIKEILALTPVQEGMLFHYLKDPGSDYYSEQLCLDLSGVIDTGLFEKAWNFVIDVNEILRTVFRWEKIKSPYQVILKKHLLQWTYYDISGMEDDDKARRLDDIKSQDRQNRFDLQHVPFRVTLCKTENERYLMIVAFHHILLDGWSNGIVLKEFFKVYVNLEAGTATAKRNKTPFKEFIKWHQNGDPEREEKAWRDYLAGLEPVELSIKRRRTVNEQATSGSIRICFDTELKKQVEQFAGKNRLTMATLFYCAWGILLQKYNNTADVVFGTTISGRSAKLEGIAEMVGLFINTIPLRIRFLAGEHSLDLLRRVQNSLQDREPFEHSSLLKIKEFSNLNSDETLFDSIVVLENYPIDAALNEGTNDAANKNKLSILSYAMTETTHYDLSLGITLFNEIVCHFQYRQEMLDGEAMQRLAGYFVRIVAALVERPFDEAAAVEILSEEEKKCLLIDFNDTAADYPRDKAIHELFAEQAEKTPDHIALSGESVGPVGPVRLVRPVCLTYRQLNDQSDRMACLLIEKGVLADTIVGIMMKRSLEMVIGIFGILKSGGAYMPIDPEYPQERIDYMLKDSTAKMLLTAVESVFNFHHTSFITHHSNHLAYLIYTSGSTGKPKGVMVNHASIVNTLWALERTYPFTRTSVYLLKTSYIFDVSLTELFSWFIGVNSGGRLAILGPGAEKDPQAILDTLSKMQVSHINFVPSMFNVLVDQLCAGNTAKLSTLKYIFLAGEALLPEVVNKFRRWNRLIKLENLYGPTEAAIYASRFRLADWSGDGNIPIGKPVDNVQIYILNRDYMQLQSLGVAGELYLGGAGLARGYLNQPELTSEKFILPSTTKKPFEKGPHGGRGFLDFPKLLFYKTGDLGRWLPDGNIEFLGRIDHQVKIRGYRIELGEIENCLLNYDMIKEAVVTQREGHGGENFLCAYLVYKDTVAPAQRASVPAELREYLAGVLPGYMIPARFVPLEKIPLTSSGKVDQRALPEPYSEEIGRVYAAPENNLQAKLAALWGEVLGVDTKSISIDDNFFHLGGHSLRAVSLSSQIHKALDVRVPLATLLQNPTIRVLARYIESSPGAHIPGDDPEAPPQPVEEKEYYPLSSNQRAFYILQQFDKDRVLLNVPLAIPLDGNILIEKITAVFQYLIRRHESLRTSFFMLDDQPVLPIHHEVAFNIEFISESYIKNFIRPFDLSRAPLLRVALVKMTEEKHLLLMDMHHLITDGSSMGIVAREFMTLYQGNSEEALTPVAVRYRDFVQWRIRMLETGKMREHETYWLEKLAGDLPILDLPTDFHRPVSMSFAGDSFSFRMAEELSQGIRRLALDTGATLYMVLMAAYTILLHKITGQADIIVNSPVSGREHPWLGNTVGLVMDAVMMRNHLRETMSVSAFLRETGQNVLEAFQHQVYPFEELLKKLDYKKIPGRSPIADVALIMLNMFGPGETAVFNRDSDEPRPAVHETYFHKTAKMDITVSALETGSGGAIACVLEYCTALFKRESMERFTARFQQVLKEMVENPSMAVWEIDIVIPGEKQQLLYEFNGAYDDCDLPVDNTVIALFRLQAEKTPDHVALVGADLRVCPVSLTYRQLNDQSDRLAFSLIEKGVLVGDIVGIMIERSIEMIIGILGILKSGGAYLPIDPGSPQERIDYMLKDSAVRILINKSETRNSKYETNPNDQKINDQNKNRSLVLDFEHLNLSSLKGCPRRGLSNFDICASDFSSSNLAYIIYTSGTTGRPKGVMVEHGNLAAYLFAFDNEFNITAGDRVLQQASYTFDTFGEEVYPLLSKGGVVIIAPGNVVKDAGLLSDFLWRYGITIIDCSPLLLNELNQRPVPVSVRLYISGGDVLRGEYIDNLLAEGKIVYNTYGPTESTICATYFKCEPGVSPEIPIGKPIFNYTLYILDKNECLQPIGIGGELCIAGPGVARGYLNNPELTAEKFIFSFNRSNRSYRTYIKLYKTGDLARWLWDGSIQFLGRVDRQVKVRGFRIELPEIERNLLSFKGVGQVVAAVKKRGPGDRYICAYIVPRDGATVIAKELRAHLSRVLPAYMLPSYFIQLEQIPLTANGKINMKALPEPAFSRHEPGTYSPPRSVIEEKLAEVWTGVLLGRQRDDTGAGPYAQVGIDDNFYEIGGDSIKAIQVSARLKDYGLEMKIDDLFRRQTIRSLVDSEAVAKTQRDIPQETVTGAVELTPIQEWFFGHHFTGGHHFNQSVMLYRRQGFEEGIVRQVFEKIASHHDALRMTFRCEGDRVIQVNRGLDGELFYLEVLGLENVKAEAIEKVVREEASRIQGGIDLETGPLMRLGLFKTGQGDHLLIAIHHLVIDTVSWRIILEDFSTGYRQVEKGETPLFPLKTDSFQRWAARLCRYAGGEEIAGQAAYWEEIERKEVKLLPRDHPVKIEDRILGNTETIDMTLDKENTGKLLKGAKRAYNTEINDLLLTALGLAAAGLAHTTNILITLEGHGREPIIRDLDISRTVGWYTTRFPVLLEMGAGDMELSRQLKQVKEKLRHIPHRGIGYGILKYLAPGRKLEENGAVDDPDITFNYLGQFDQFNRNTPGSGGDEEAAVFTISPLPVGRTHSPRVEWRPALDISGMILEGELRLSFSYNSFEYEKIHLQELVNRYRSYLLEIIDHCCRKEKSELTPSDLDYHGLTMAEWEELQERVAKISSGAGIKNVYPLGPMQAGMFFHYLENPSGGAYFEQGAVSIRGQIDLELLKKSFAVLAERYDILRTLFYRESAGRFLQVVLEHDSARQIDFHFEDISAMHLTDEETKDYLQEAKKKEREQKFDLLKEIPIRISLYRTNQAYLMVWNFHHILMDGWCIAVLFKELMQVYSQLKASKPVQLPLPVPYRDYIAWLGRRDKEKSLHYWQEYLRDYEQAVTVLEVDRTGPAGADYHFELREHVLLVEESLSGAIAETARANRVTGNVVLQTAWGILLQRYNNCEDAVFGGVVAGRPAEIEGIEHMVGLFINTVPVRVQGRGEMLVSELLAAIHKNALAAKSHEYLLLADIQALTPLNRQLLDHIMIFENYPIQKELTGVLESECGFAVENVEYLEQSNYDLSVAIVPGSVGNSLMVKFTFNAHRSEAARIKQIGTHFREVLRQIAFEPGMELRALEIVTEEEKKRLLMDFNETAAEYPCDKTIHELFAAQVIQTPDHIALVGADLRVCPNFAVRPVNLSYLELNEQSDRMACVLIEKGILVGDIVGIMMERSVDLVIGILGILKSGGAYLPIDPEYPQKRINYMLKDSSVKTLLTAVENVFNFHHLSFIIHHSSHLAYIIYTSGSTGQPKGVMVTHRNAVRLVKNTNFIPLTQETRILQTGAPVFDATTFEIWGSLLNGGQLVLVANEVILDARRLGDALKNYFINTLWLSAPLFNRLEQQGSDLFAPLSYLLVGGDVLSPGHIDRVKQKFPGLKIINGYGPTENTTFSTTFEITEEYKENIPIGKPIANSTAYILDKYANLQPVGVAGELCVGGDGVARGYLNQPELTADKYYRTYESYRTYIFYKTGDLARWLSDGNIEFLGRIDHQVKIRGYRIELGEIENRMLGFNGINEAVVLVKEDRKEDKYLSAYIVSHCQVDDSQLRLHLSGCLPDYMVPSYFVQLEKMPLTPNGKIDRKALMAIDAEPGGNRESYEAPANETERSLVEIWSDVLGVKGKAIGVYDDFFRLGGHSLKAMGLTGRIKKAFSVEVPLGVLFKTPFIRGIAGYIRQNAGIFYCDIGPVEEKEYYALSPAQQRLYFLNLFETVGTSYNMTAVLEVAGTTDKDRFEDIFQRLIRRHESLRTSFLTIDGDPVQKVCPVEETPFVIEYRDETGDTDSLPVIEEIMWNFIRPFDLTCPPLLRVSLVKIDQTKHFLLFDMHHIISDGTSMGILIREFTALYNEGILPPLQIQYKDFSEWQNSLIASGKTGKQEEYWLNLYAGEIPRLELPTDYPRPEVFVFAGDTLEFSLDSRTSGAFKELCMSRGVTLYMGLLTVFNILVSRYSGQEDIIVGSGIAGRNHDDLRNMIGLFVNMLAMRNYPAAEKNIRDFMEEVRENALKAFENEAIQFEDLVRRLELQRDPSRNPLFDVNLVVQNFEQSELQAGDITFKPHPIKDNTAKFDITLFTWETGDDISFSMEYCTALFKPGTMTRMKNHFLNIIGQLANRPDMIMSTTIGEVDFLSEIEKHQLLYEFNEPGIDFPRDKTIHELFAEQVARTPDHLAVFCHGHASTTRTNTDNITYRELSGQANRVAAFLHYGPGLHLLPDDLVIIFMASSIELFIAILGVLKAGAAYLPIDPSLPEDRIKHIIDDATVKVVLSQKRFLRTLNRLQWECSSFHTYLCLDSMDIDAEQEAEKSNLMDKELWEFVGNRAKDDIEGGGWLSSYTGEPISAAEMNEYGDNALQKLLPLLDEQMRVLEIGCATGITMYRVAPRVRYYLGTDLSAAIIEKNKERVNRESQQNIALSCLAAHEIDTLKSREAPFDLIIINSVIQTFHGHNYLRHVIRVCVDLLGDRGYLFIGDVMDQQLKKELTRELREFQRANRGKNYKTKTDFSQELFISREFFEDLAVEIPSIKDVEFSPKIHTIENELTKFRYDTLITIDKHRENKKGIKHKYREDLRALERYGDGVESMITKITAGNLAYVIYTSGSTGRPKGVMVDHRSLVNLCGWHNRNFSITSCDRATKYAGLGFDASVWEIFPYLIAGAGLYIIDGETRLEVEKLKRYFTVHRITIGFLPTQMCEQFMFHVASPCSLRILLTGGDKLQKFVSRDYRLINNYGPTENTVVTTSGEVNENLGRMGIPIGKPISNVRVYILDKQNLLQPVGAAGELCIGGEGLAVGYLNNPELTAEKFFNFHHSSFNIHHSLLYRTGDLVKWLPGGNIEFMGRVDGQVKIRGYRIEPGEVENLLLDRDDIEAAIVMVSRRKDDDTGIEDRYLCAYYVVAKNITEQVDSGELKQYLSGKLPGYMIPQYFAQIEKIPLTANGKVDRKGLPKPDREENGADRPGYVPPSNEVEEKLAELWQDVLGIWQPGINDNFFEVGGDSIKAIQVTARLREYGLELQISDLFLNPTIKGSALCVKEIETAIRQEIVETGVYAGISNDMLEEFENEFSDID